MHVKVLWLVNILLPAQCEHLGLPVIPVGGWIEGMMRGLGGTEVSLLILATTNKIKESLVFNHDGITYITLPTEKNMEKAFSRVLEQQNPDLIHVFGTEMQHSLDMMRVVDPQRAMVQIQGLVSVCAPLFLEGLPYEFQKSTTAKERARKLQKYGSVFFQQLNMMDAGKNEKETLFRAQHILGHTTWDYAHTQQMAPHAQYYCFSEILREEFYSGQWAYENTRPYSIFISQAATPIKGAHMLFNVLPDIVRDFPDTHVYVGGFYPSSRDFGNQSQQFDYYSYLRKLLTQTNMIDYVTFLGVLSASEMKYQYLASNVFVSCSIMENESNSLSEAKMLGVPSVASYVGGVTDRIHHGIDGFYYPFNEPQILRYYICQIFESPELACKLSVQARKNALLLNDYQKATTDILNIYRKIYSQSNVQ